MGLLSFMRIIKGHLHMQYVIGCDIGWQSPKEVLLDLRRGKICGKASASYHIEYP
jgi:sugar (pentulose or hexulose) kinase